MKIIVNARFLTQPLSGVQRYGIECSRQIKKLHPDAVFVAPKGILHNDIAKELNVKIIGSNTGHLWEQADLPLYLARQGYPPLLSLANTAPWLYSNNYITIHDLAFFHHPEWNSKKFSAWYNILVPRIAQGARHIFTVSHTVAGELAKHYHIPSAKITVAYNGLSQRMCALGPWPGGRKEKIILAVGTFNIRKNHPALVSAFLGSKLKEEYQLVIIGDRNRIFTESQLDVQVVAGNNIKIYETLNEDELIAMYRKAEVVVSLSLYEGFGIPVLEGLYNGCKVLCSDIPVYRELYSGKVDFCDPQNINNISGALEAITGKSAISPDGISALAEQYNYARTAQTILNAVADGNKKRKG